MRVIEFWRGHCAWWRTRMHRCGATSVCTAVAGGMLMALVAAEQPAPTDVRTVEVRNECEDPVGTYWGATPPQRPEDVYPMPGQSSVAHPLLQGSTLWLIGADGVTVAQASVGPLTDAIVVGSDCESLLRIDAAQPDDA